MSYEFNEEENEVFLDLTRNMISLALIIGIIGSVSLLRYFFNTDNYFGLSIAISFIALAVALYLPIGSFKRIVTSEGSDIKELMTGLRSASKGWLIVNIVFALNRIILIIIMYQAIN